MQKPNSVTVGIIVITLVIFGGIIMAASLSRGAPIARYKIGDLERPRLEIFEINFDFGAMTLADKRSKDIKISNQGSKSLIISELVTSCDCTFAEFIINGQASPLFSMRRDLEWRGEIAPASAAILKIIYEPRIMPVQGKVKRDVVFKTNDPENPLINVSFTADVR
ncbi:MAG: DUF1573 domain-containing protein [bacterium]|nr:DUF1573 domain-containing protein [bacterium]